MHGHMFFLHIDENPWRQAMCHYLPIVALATGVVAQLDLCSQRAKHDLHLKKKNVFMQIYHDTLAEALECALENSLFEMGFFQASG